MHIVTERASLAALPVSANARVWLIDDESLYADDRDIARRVARRRAATGGLRDLYIGLDGQAEGRDRRSRFVRAALRGDRRSATARASSDVFLLFQSVNFDGAHEGWFSQYMSGAAVAITADTLWPPALTCKLMAREGVTMTYVPPGCATQLAEWALAHGAPPTLAFADGRRRSHLARSVRADAPRVSERAHRQRLRAD